MLNTAHVVLGHDRFASSAVDHINILITEEFTDYEICLAADVGESSAVGPTA